MKKTSDHSFKNTISSYSYVLKHNTLLAGIFILGIVMIEQLIYPTIGVFLVQNNMGYSSVKYGNTALLIGCCYLIGTLINRIMLNHFPRKKLVYIGLTIILASAGIQLILALVFTLNIWSLVLTIMTLNIGLGFIFGNIIGFCLQLFPKNAGINIAVQTCYLMAISALGIYIISGLNITKLLPVSIIYLTLGFIQLSIFHYFVYEKLNDL